MHRSKNAEFINKLVNDPSIRPMAGGDGVSIVDFSPTFNDFISLEGKGGAWLFFEEEKDVYECHYFFLPKFRGKYAVAFGKKVLRYMFDVIGAKRLIGRAPVENKLTSFYNIAIGAKKRSVEEVYIPQLDWRYMAQIFTLDKDEWLCPQL